MKKGIVCFSLLAIVALWAASLQAYRIGRDRGHAQGIQDERLCWELDPVTVALDNNPGTLARDSAQPEVEVVTAHRDLRKHPFEKPARPIRITAGGTAIRNNVPLPDSH